MYARAIHDTLSRKILIVVMCLLTSDRTLSLCVVITAGVLTFTILDIGDASEVSCVDKKSLYELVVYCTVLDISVI